jgi:hypothetical protein
VAVVIGADPTVFLASQFVPGIDVDEFTIAGALRKAPVELVPCEMVNIEVPATSEIVLEGTLIIPAEVGDEGPYGEFCGYLVGTVIRGRLTAVFSDACFGFAQEARIRVGYSAMSDSMAWVWAAKEGGY